MLCADFEVLLCDYLDGTLDADLMAEVERHMHTCAACAEMAANVGAAVRFVANTQTPEPPPALISRIAFDIPSGGMRRGWWESVTGWLQPLLQPRFAMGMAMTLLSFSMLGRFAGIEVRQLRPSDLHPAAVWSAVDDRMHRTWERAVKYYENLRLVYEVQSRLQEWTREEEERNGRAAEERNSDRSGAEHSGVQGNQSEERKTK